MSMRALLGSRDSSSRQVCRARNGREVAPPGPTRQESKTEQLSARTSRWEEQRGGIVRVPIWPRERRLELALSAFGGQVLQERFTAKSAVPLDDKLGGEEIRRGRGQNSRACCSCVPCPHTEGACRCQLRASAAAGRSHPPAPAARAGRQLRLKVRACTVAGASATGPRAHPNDNKTRGWKCNSPRVRPLAACWGLDPNRLCVHELVVKPALMQSNH